MRRSALLLLLVLLAPAACSDPAAPRIPTPQEERNDPGRGTGKSLDDTAALARGVPSAHA